MRDFYENINYYNPNKENKILIVFYDMIADLTHNKKLDSIATELFIRGRKLNIYLVFITQSYVKVPKDVRLNTTHFSISKIPNKGELKKGNKNHRSREQKNALCNIEILYKARNEAIKFYKDYSLMMSEAKTKATKGTGLKILTPKQMLQRLPIALAQVKAGNNSEILLNEIRQIVYSLYQPK